MKTHLSYNRTHYRAEIGEARENRGEGGSSGFLWFSRCHRLSGSVSHAHLALLSPDHRQVFVHSATAGWRVRCLAVSLAHHRHKRGGDLDSTHLSPHLTSSHLVPNLPPLHRQPPLRSPPRPPERDYPLYVVRNGSTSAGGM